MVKIDVLGDQAHIVGESALQNISARVAAAGALGTTLDAVGLSLIANLAGDASWEEYAILLVGHERCQAFKQMSKIDKITGVIKIKRPSKYQ